MKGNQSPLGRDAHGPALHGGRARPQRGGSIWAISKAPEGPAEPGSGEGGNRRACGEARSPRGTSAPRRGAWGQDPQSPFSTATTWEGTEPRVKLGRAAEDARKDTILSSDATTTKEKGPAAELHPRPKARNPGLASRNIPAEVVKERAPWGRGLDEEGARGRWSLSFLCWAHGPHQAANL